MGENGPDTSDRGGARVTAMDVAEEAGVSMSAVSRVFTPGASVSARMRARVSAAADKLGYMPNVLARSLMTQRTHLVGIILANFNNPIYLTVLEHFTRTLQQRGLRTLLLNVSNENDLEAMSRLVLQYSVDGLVVSAAGISPFITEQCVKRKIPLVAFARRPRAGQLNIVCADNVAGGRMAARRLLDAGHRTFGFLGGPPAASTSTDRGNGFRAEIEEAGLTVAASTHASDYGYEAGVHAARRMLSGDHRPEAIFCASDITAFGVLDVARHEFGLSVPGDLSVVGFDDVNLAAASSYNLTTISQPVASMVTEAIDILGRQMEAWTGAWETRLMACTCIERGTVRG